MTAKSRNDSREKPTQQLAFRGTEESLIVLDRIWRHKEQYICFCKLHINASLTKTVKALMEPKQKWQFMVSLHVKIII